jgi:uncharacterized protein (TIGR00251 family)
MVKYKKHPKGVSFKVYVQPKASKNETMGVYGDAIKIRLTAPPVDGAANKMCLKYLAKCLCVPVSCLEILSGHSIRTKYVLLKTEHGKIEADNFNHLKRQIEDSLLPKETA